MDKAGDLYMSHRDTIKGWKEGERKETIVAGGNGTGNALNQLVESGYFFVAEDFSIYITDSFNHRVVKWTKNAKQGIVVAGGQGSGADLTQLTFPTGLFVDHNGYIYVADNGDSRIMRYSKGSQQGTVILSPRQTSQPDEYSMRAPGAISVDRQGNLYVVERVEAVVQKFHIYH